MRTYMMLDFFDLISRKLSRDKFVAVVLVAAGFFVYANALLNDFVWDDEEQVVNNTVIRDWDNVGMVFTSSTFYAGGAGLSGGFYRPLVTLSYFWNYAYWGLNPLGYHLMQLMLHCANVFLVFYLLKTIFEKNNAAGGRMAAFAAALVFAVHPANVESVAYVGSIGEVGYTFFVLSGLVLFIKSIDGNGSIAKLRYFYGSFMLVFLGLLAKEPAIVALFLLLAYSILFIKPSKTLYLRFTGGAALAVGTYLFLRLKIAEIAPVSTFYAPIHLAPLWQRLMTVPYEIISYIGIIVFPKDLSISRHFVVTTAADPKFWGSLIALAAIAAAILFYIIKTRSKVFSFFVLWFCLTLAPVLNIIPLDMTMAERWLYFPLIGFLAATSFAGFGAVEDLSLAKRNLVAAVLAATVIIFGIVAIERNSDWRNGLSLYGHDITLAGKVSPRGSFDLENNYGVELFRAGKIDEAGEYFKKSIELQSNWASPQNNLGAVLEHQGDLEGALNQYRKAADMGYYLGYQNVSGILIKMKRYGEAREFLELSLAKLPNNLDLTFKLAYLYAADNIGNDKDAKQKALYLLAPVLQADPQNQNAAALYEAIQSGQKIEI